jgi:hypothetical protein
MTKAEQHRMIKDLQGHAARMNRTELESFEMLRKRDKDDEDLDALAIRTLEQLHARFLPTRTKTDVDDLWKKFSSKSPPETGE